MVDYDEIQLRVYRGTLSVLQDIAYHPESEARTVAEEVKRVLQDVQQTGSGGTQQESDGSGTS